MLNGWGQLLLGSIFTQVKQVIHFARATLHFKLSLYWHTFYLGILQVTLNQINQRLWLQW